MEERFICDVHLGKLAKWLRMLGFDTAYENYFINSELVNIALAEHRFLFSRNKAFEKSNSIQFFHINNENPEEQLFKIISHFQLKDKFHPFTRCIVCNGLLKPSAKSEVEKYLQRNTAEHFNEFWQCTNCNRIYWKGSHYERMEKLIELVERSTL